MVFVKEYLDIIDADAFSPGCYGDYDSIGFGSVNGILDLDETNIVVESGKMCFIWTCNDHEMLKLLTKSSISGVVTDYPNRFFEVHKAAQGL